MNESELTKASGTAYFDLWHKLSGGWPYLASGLGAGLAVALGAIALLPARYEAVAILQVGQVGQVGQVTGQVTSQPVEFPSQTVERMKTPAFQRKAAEAAGDQEWIQDLAESSSGMTKYFAVQVMKGTVAQGQIPVVELKAQGETAATAKKRVNAAIAELVKAHDQLAGPTIDKLRAELVLAKEKLASAEKDLEGLGKLLASARLKDDRFTQLSLMTSLRLQKEADFYGQRQTIMALETALSSPATQQAKAIEAVFVSDKPVFPKKGLFISLGIVGGLLAGIVLLFAKDTWQGVIAATSWRKVA